MAMRVVDGGAGCSSLARCSSSRAAVRRRQHAPVRCSSSGRSSSAEAPPVLTRRQAAAALLATAAAAGAAPPARAADPGFYSQWPYVSPSDILPYLRATATPGEPAAAVAPSQQQRLPTGWHRGAWVAV